MNDRINDEYFEWLCSLVNEDDGRNHAFSYSKLLTYLHSVIFRYSIPMDDNRAEDGIDMRYRFSLDKEISNAPAYLCGPCTVLEMMVALAIRCEESIMDNPNIGDRTRQWFWNMINNLGLGGMRDDLFDEEYVEGVVSRFLDREYDSDGRGGLFWIKNCDCDLREVEIWYQLCWYLDRFE